jgi:O-antigen ligase
VIPWALWRSAALDAALGTFVPALIMMGVVLSAPPTDRTLHTFERVFVATTAVNVVALFTRGDWQGGGRLSGQAAFDANDMGSLVAMAVCFAVSLMLRARGLQRWLWLGAAGVLTVSVGWFNSRGGTLAFAGGLLTFVIMQPGSRRWLLLGAIVISGPLFWAGAPQVFKDRIIGLSNLDADYNNTDYYGRRQIWARARRYIVENPVTGLGLGGFPVQEGKTLAQAGSAGKWSNTHNAYLQAYAELGMLGGSMFVGILLLAAKQAWRVARPNRRETPTATPRPEYFSALVAFAVGATFLSHAYFIAFFGLLSLIALAYRTTLAQQATSPFAGPAPPPPLPSRGWRTARSTVRQSSRALHASRRRSR